MARTATRPPDAIVSEHVALGLAPLTADAVSAQTDSGSFSRGRGYARSGHIFGAIRRENVLRARSHGSSGGPYVVEATLAKTGTSRVENPLDFACDCPRGGFCKHVVALLLTWIDRPESFTVRPPVTDLLAGKSQIELIALIDVMLRQNPDLEELLDLPLPVAGDPGDDLVDDASIRRQVVAAMEDDGGYQRRSRYTNDYNYDDYYPGSRIASRLERLATLADTYADVGQWRNALVISATLAEELAPRFVSFQFQDGNGDLSSLLSRSDLNLSACLEAQEQLPDERRLPTEERTRLIDALFLIWQTSIDAGGLDLANEGPETIAHGASLEEQQRVRDRLRGMMKPPIGESWHHATQNRAVIWFMSLLAGEAGLSDEELLTEYRNAELWDDAAEMLIQLDRVDEAVSLAFRRLTAATALTPFADRLIATGDANRIEQAIALVDDRLWEQEGQNARDDQVLREWLERRYAEFGRPEKALELAHGRFKSSPGKATYEAVKTAALLPGQPDDPWPALRPTLLAVLRKRGDWYGLIHIHLAEGEVAEAIAALKKTEKPSRGGQSSRGNALWAPAGGYDAHVAAAAEAEFPDEAIRIYRRLADQNIAARGRASYQTAATYLVRVMRLLEANGRAEEWPPLIAELRQNTKSLRALKEELDSLGLG